MHALPNENETIKAIQNLDLLVVVDVIPSEIAGKDARLKAALSSGQ